MRRRLLAVVLAYICVAGSIAIADAYPLVAAFGIVGAIGWMIAGDRD